MHKFFKVFLIFITLFLSACGSSIQRSGQEITNISHCVLPADQGQGSLRGAWGNLPIPVVLDKGFYLTNAGEAALAIKRAISTWNGWASVKGKTGFTISQDGTGLGAGQEIPNITSCTATDYISAVSDKVGIWKIQTGGLGKNLRDCGAGVEGRILPTGIQGLTQWTTSGTNISAAVILLNFEEFNIPGQVQIDLESLALHELGHVLGLLHSCNPGPGDITSAPSCSAGSTSLDYLQAVMFPYLLPEQIRRQIQQNDYNRINCLY